MTHNDDDDTRTVVARWETTGGARYAELYRDAFGYGYTATSSGGFIGKHTDVSEADAVAWMTGRTRSWKNHPRGGHFHGGRTDMHRTV